MPTDTGQTTYLEAVGLALDHEMNRDPDVFLIGEDVGQYGGGDDPGRGLLVPGPTDQADRREEHPDAHESSAGGRGDPGASGDRRHHPEGGQGLMRCATATLAQTIGGFRIMTDYDIVVLGGGPVVTPPRCTPRPRA